MRLIKISILLIIVLLVILSCINESQIDKQKDLDTIEEISAARADAFNEGDAAAIAIHFTENGLLMAPGSPVLTGRIAVEEYYQEIFDEYETSLDSYYEDVQVSGNLAFGRGVADVELVPKVGGNTIHSTSKYINILQKQADGSWLTTHDIWNNNE